MARSKVSAITVTRRYGDQEIRATDPCFKRSVPQCNQPRKMVCEISRSGTFIVGLEDQNAFAIGAELAASAVLISGPPRCAKGSPPQTLSVSAPNRVPGLLWRPI